MEAQYHLKWSPLPEGFRIYVNYVPVMGISLRRADAVKFCNGSDRQLAFEPEPGNKHDANAIKVVGSWKGWLGRKSRDLGYVPAEHAAKLTSLNLIAKVRPRLLKTYAGDDGFVEVEFQIIGPKELYETFSPRLPAVAAESDHNRAALTRLDRLTTFLARAPKLNQEQLAHLRKASIAKAIDAMLIEGKTLGEASGGPDFLNKPEGEFRAHLRSIDNDLDAQVEIVEGACRRYFEQGEYPAPYYPHRIAIILAKLKEKVRERDFLEAWCGLFEDGVEGPSGFAQRARKLRAKFPD